MISPLSVAPPRQMKHVDHQFFNWGFLPSATSHPSEMTVSLALATLAWRAPPPRCLPARGRGALLRMCDDEPSLTKREEAWREVSEELKHRLDGPADTGCAGVSHEHATLLRILQACPAPCAQTQMLLDAVDAPPLVVPDTPAGSWLRELGHPRRLEDLVRIAACERGRLLR